MMSNLEDMFSDPVPADDNDPEIQEEVFKLHKASGAKPADLKGATPEIRAKYAAWLESEKA